jgi:hypothetical protein
MDNGKVTTIFSRKDWATSRSIRAEIIRDLAKTITEEKNGEIHYFIRSNYNWADEADFPGFSIMTKDQYEDAIETIEEYFKDEDKSELEVYVGTNEWIEFSSASDVDVAYETLSKQEAETLVNRFGTDFGEINLNKIIKNINEEYE